LRKLAPGIDIEVDGGVDLGNVEKAAAAGANVIVAGTSVFHAPDPAAALRRMRELAEKAHGV
jgi:ribulose-phosphate 3-epimerase